MLNTTSKPATTFTLTTSTAPAGGFTFGGGGDKTPSSKAPLFFGQPTSSTGFSFSSTPVAPSTGLSFGATLTPKTAASVTGFAAPIPSSTTNTSTPQFSFSSSTTNTAASLAPIVSATTSTGFQLGSASTSSGFQLGSTTTSAAGFQLGGATSTPGFQLGGAPTTSSGFQLGASTTTPSSGFQLGSAPISSTGFQLGTAAATTSGIITLGSLTTTAPASTALKLSFPQTTSTLASVPSVVTTSSSALLPAIPTTSTASNITYNQLEDQINKWTLDLEEQGKHFINQAKQLNAWDTLLIQNGDKIRVLNGSIERVKQQQQQLDQELDFVLAQQKELEELVGPLEKELAAMPQSTDQERNRIYQLAESMDSQMKQMSEDLKGIIEHLNESNKEEDSNDPVTQISRILNAHMNSLQWIDRNTAQISSYLEQISKMQDINRRNNAIELQ